MGKCGSILTQEMRGLAGGQQANTKQYDAGAAQAYRGYTHFHAHVPIQYIYRLRQYYNHNI